MSTTEATPADLSEGAKYLNLRLGDEHYGVEILRVREIIGMLDITPLPQMPAYVRGVINLRGKIIPVVDLRMRLGMEPIPYDPRTCIVVLDVASSDASEAGDLVQIGCIVDTVSEVREMPPELIESTPDLGAERRSDFVQGLAKVPETNQVVSLLDVDQLLSFSTELSDAAQEAAGAPEAA